MKRFLIYGSLTLLLGIFCAGEFGLKWLLETPDGVSWLIRTISRNTPVTITARTITGGINATLRLEDVSARWPEGELTVADLRLRCQPLLLPFRTLSFQELSLRKVRLQDNSPPKSNAPELVWPHITGFPSRINAWIDKIDVDDFSYQNRNQPPVSIPHVSAVMSWQDSRLRITYLSLTTTQGRISGTLTAGFGKASLESALNFEALNPLAGCNRFDLHTRLHSGRTPEQVAGEITATALAGNIERYTLAGTVGLTQKELNLRGVTLTEKGRQGSIKADGSLLPTGTARLRLRASGLDLTQELGEKVAVSGTIDLNGDSERYAGRFDLSTSGQGWRKSRLAALFTGNPDSIDLSSINAALLSGVVQGNLRIGWQNELMLKGALQGRGLDPSVLDPTWDGSLNFNLNSTAIWSKGRLQQGQIQASLLQSRLRGKALSGEIDATLQEKNLRIARLFLTGNGIDLHASGTLSDRLNMAANISDLSSLIPRSKGVLSLTGWGRYSNGIISADFSGDGHNLAVEGLQIASTSLKARIEDKPLRVLVASAHMSGVMYQGLKVDNTSLTATCTDGKVRFVNAAAKLAGVTYQGLQVQNAAINAKLTDGTDRVLSSLTELSGITYRGLRADNASLKADGSLNQHRLGLTLHSKDAEIIGIVSGGYARDSWQGEITSLSGHDLVGPWHLTAPAALSISPRAVTVGSLVLIGMPSERFELDGRLKVHPLQGVAQSAWNGLDLSRANQWLDGTRITGLSSGNLLLGLPSKEQLHLTGKASASGTVTMGTRTVSIDKALLDLDAGDRGTTALLELRTVDGISVAGRFTSLAPATLSIPSRGELHASWEGLDAAQAKRWLPPEFDLKGRLSGEVTGTLLPKQSFTMSGSVGLMDGSASWHSEGRELTAAIQSSGLTWNWRGDSLSGAVSMSLAHSGKAQANFQLPLPARFDTAPDQAGPIKGTLSGTFNEKGLLTILFPGLFREAKGQLELNLRAEGTWQTPVLTGTAALTQAGAYLPSAGIHLTDVGLNAKLEGSHVNIDSFRVTSGSGSIEGSADLTFAGKNLLSYHGKLSGEKFQAVRLPELQLTASPNITFEGDLTTLTAKGLVRIPEMLVNSQSSSTVIKPSRDVVLLGKSVTALKQSGPKLDLQIRLLLGDQVNVKTEGLNARLEGELDLRMSDPSTATGRGEIKVIKGSYQIYGVKLDIKRGRALFSGGSVEQPALDILALRVVDDVKAGVTVTGTPEAPLIKLYSEPTLPDTDIMSYIVLGHKMEAGGMQTDLLMQAASLLTSPGQSAGLQDQLKQLVGLDTLTYSKDPDRSSGYKVIEPGISNNPKSSTASNGVSQSMLLLGKYLTPKLYVSYGRSLFTDSQQFRARYTLSKQWEVESKVSVDATGGDLYYRIELD